MTTAKIIKSIADLNGVPPSALSSPAYKSDYNWQRIATAKHQASYILSFQYHIRDIAHILGYKSHTEVLSGIRAIKKQIKITSNDELMISLLGAVTKT